MKKINYILDDFLRHKNMFVKIKGTLPLLDWDRIVGEKLARLTQPVYYKDGVLYISVKEPLLRREIKLIKPDIISKIRNIIQDSSINDIKVLSQYKAHSFSKKEKVESHYLEDVELSSDDLKWIDSMVQRLNVEKKSKGKYRELLTAYKKSVRKKEAIGFKKCSKCGVYFSSDGPLCPVCELEDRQ